MKTNQRTINLQKSLPLKVVHFFRKPPEAAYSIEGLFETLAIEMSNQGAVIDRQVSPFPSRGVLRRLLTILWAFLHRGSVNHVTGDIHFIAIALPQQTTILTIHDLGMLDRLKGWRRRVVSYIWFDLPVRCSRYITVVSEETKRTLHELLDVADSKVIVIPNAISPRFQPSPKLFNSSKPTILQIGSTQNKNVSRVIEALKGLDVLLHLVGLRTRAELDLLEETGLEYKCEEELSDAEILNAYQQCDIVSFVSLSEGFGLPILEAQWIERPVVTSNCSSMPGVAGDAACFVNPLDTASIRAGFLRVIEDAGYRESLIERGRQNRRRFDLTTVAAMYVDLYKQVLAEPTAK